MGGLRRTRDIQLLDAVDAIEPSSFKGEAWRVTRNGVDPLVGYPSNGRWDPGTFDVICCSLERQVALAEIHFHLSRQPVFPSVNFNIHCLSIKTRKTLQLADMRALAELGVKEEHYSRVQYARTQDIGDAAKFLGHDGLLVPSARSNGRNLVIFTDAVAPENMEILNSEPVDWNAWRGQGSSS